MEYSGSIDFWWYLGFGSIKGRFGGENLRRFEDCWLCLRPAVKPVCTPRGMRNELVDCEFHLTVLWMI